MAKDRISLCMIVRDEARRLEAAIASVRPAVYEIVVVDTGSEDATPDIARALGARVFSFQWREDFAAARNFSISKAKGDWILVLDADELVDPRDLPLLAQLTADPHVCYKLVQRHYLNNPGIAGFRPVCGEFPEREAGFCGYTESNVVRLFPRRSRIRFQGCIHEVVEPAIARIKDLRVAVSHLRLHHYGQADEAIAAKRKRSVYSTLGRRKAGAAPGLKSFYEIGVEECLGGRFQDGAEALERAIAANPRYAPAHLNLAHAYHHLRRYGEALAVLARALKIFPHSPELLTNYGTICAKLGRYEIAEQAYCLALKADPQNAQAMLYLGKAFACLGKTREALVTLQHCVEVLSRHHEPYLALSDLHLRLGDEAAALETLRSGAERALPCAELHLRLAAQLEKHGCAADALRAYRRFGELERAEHGAPSAARQKRLELAEACCRRLQETAVEPRCGSQEFVSDDSRMRR